VAVVSPVRAGYTDRRKYLPSLSVRSRAYKSLQQLGIAEQIHPTTGRMNIPLRPWIMAFDGQAVCLKWGINSY
jgi:hypothetical protein